ncbi:DEAD/DEAH box helicase [Paramicrobacterium agarici]
MQNPPSNGMNGTVRPAGSGLTVPASSDPDVVLETFTDWATQQGIELYPAQEDALLEVVSGNHLILSTPTGTGKSLVAVGAHLLALARGERSVYTAPIKALVSEKFFALVETFGAENVGMMTGDSSVNAEAPILCCTAEILANLALRRGSDTDVQQVVMDEFHYYGDPERGWAWQVPLLTLEHTQFVLMSATLGDVSDLAADLSRRTQRQTGLVTGVERPVPLSYHYETSPIHETVDELLHTNRAPVYIVHFSQAQAMERAQALTSQKIVSKEQKARIAEQIGDFRFTTAFGKSLSRLVRAGIGVHHAGMLPKYRRLVEQLAQAGLLPVICGTDTLGVGINVPIRTVLFTALTKYDGTRMRQLNAREFHQIAGRAGRAGFDTAGTVIAQAPEHETQNLKALEKAGDDPKKRRKLIRKKAPDGFVSWGRGSFDRLIAAEPETLSSHMQMTSAILINLIAQGGDVFAHVRRLVFDNHEPPAKQRELARRALSIYRTLKDAGIVDVREGGIRLTVDLPPNFALNQPLSPFALAAFDLLDPESPDFALDMISIIEATLDNPRAVLNQQEFMAKGEAVAEMKAEGIEYEQRMELLEEITWPKPLAELLEQAFETFRASQPWIADFDLAPKSVVRDMFERAMSFAEFVRFYQLVRSEGVVLRYLSDAYRTIRQLVPDTLMTEELADLVDWLGELVRQIDSSLFDEWDELAHPDAAAHRGRASELSPSPPAHVTTQTRAFRILVRSELFRRVQLASREDYDALAALDAESGFTADDWQSSLDGYFEEHDEILVGADARGPQMLLIDEGRETWSVRQIIDDPAGNHDWGISATVDLAASDQTGHAQVTVTGVNRL